MDSPKQSKHLMEGLASSFKRYENGYFFPSDDVDPETKLTPEYCLQWQEAMWSMFLRGNAYNTIQSYEQLQLLRLYGAGRQPNGIYMELLLNNYNDSNPQRTGWLSTNWEIFSPAPKLHREIKGRFEKQEFDYSATAIDPTSQAEKENKMWEVWYNSKYGAKEREVMQKIGAEIDDKVEYIAQSLEELEMWKNMGGIKLKNEGATEEVLDCTDMLSDIKTIKQKCIDDLVDWGKTAFRDYYDPNTGLTKYEYIDWENLIIDFSNETDFKDIRFWSYVKFETINNVRIKTGLTEAEIIELAKMNCGLWGNMPQAQFDQYSRWGYRTEKGVRTYNQFRVPILISEWISTDHNYKLTKTNKAGVKRTYPQEHGKVYNTENKKTKINLVNNVYQSTWIMGSKYVYDYGLSLNTARPDPKNPKLSIHAVALPGKSITESIKPCLDQLELAWVRWQSAIAKAAPNGINIDLSKLENISVDGGENLSVMQVIDLYRQTGDTLERSGGAPGGAPKYNQQGRSINRNEGGVGPFMGEIITTMDTNFKFIYELTGIDLVSSASAQGGEVTATEVKFASAATTDALQPLFTNWIQMKEDAAVSASCKINRAIKYHAEAREAYASMIGEAAVEVLRISSDKTAAQYGIHIEVRPTDQMKAAAIEAATKALQPGKNGENINLPDWWYFVDMIQRGRAKHAMAILNYRLERSKKEGIKLQEDNMRLNGENMKMAEAQKQQGKMNEIVVQGQIDMKKEAQKALLEMEVGDNATLTEMKKELIMQILTSAPGEATPTTQAA